MRKVISIVGAGLLALLASAGLSALPAAAVAPIPVTCSTLQGALTAATAGQVIMLTEADCHGAYTIPNNGIAKDFTLEGQAQADGFDGQNTNQSLSGDSNGNIVITNLTFKNGRISGSGSGAGLDLTNAGSPTLSQSIFTDNTVTAGSGGGADLQGNGTVTVTNNIFGGAGQGNVASSIGGGLAVFAPKIVISGNRFQENALTSSSSFNGGGGVVAFGSGIGSDSVVFTNNTLNGNTTRGASGAGAFLPSEGGVTVTGNLFRANVINFTNQTSSSEKGAGLDIFISPSAGTRTVTQSNNVFDSNVIHGGFVTPSAALPRWSTPSAIQPRSSTPADYGGAGEFAVATTVNSTDDTYTGNHVDSAGGISTDVPIGGAFALQGTNIGNPQAPDVKKTTLNARNLVAVNNSVGDSGEGGGIYAGFSSGCGLPPCTAEVDLFDSTVTANTVGPGGTGPELAGDTTDVAHVVNSIVTGPVAAQTDVQGFGTTTINHSDACVAGAAAAGTGNICKDPQLVNVAANDVHETAQSPTIDAGDTAQVPSDLPQDYKGLGRVQGAAVDMGAAEFVPAAAVLPALPKAGRPGSAPGNPVPVVLLGLAIALFAVAAGARRTRMT